MDDSDIDDSIFCESNILDCNNVCDGPDVLDACGICGGSGRIACDTSTTTPGASCGLGGEYYCSSISGDEAANCYVVDDCGECNGPGIPVAKCDCNGNVNDCAGVCGGSSVVDSCGVCGGSGTERFYLDADNDSKVDTSKVVFACDQPTNYVSTYTEVDPDDNCTNELYDGCGVCANIDGNGTSELGYLSTLSTSNCQGSSWTAENCILDTDGDGLITTYNVLGHPNDNAMDCAGVCLNEYNEGTYGQAFIDSSYLDSDLDGWGDPITGEAFCNIDGLSPDGRVINNNDLDDDITCEFISSAVDCAGNCKYLSDSIDDINPEYIAEILLLTGCIEDKPHLAGCDYCGICSGSGRSMYYLDADNDAKADTSSFVYDCEEPDNYILDYDEVDPDDNCKNEVYDGCGVCADLDGNGTTGLGYLETMTAELCIGPNWTAENCLMDTNQDSIITPYHVIDHPYDSGMDCAGICLNEYNDGTFGQATLNTYYRDADNDSWGDPNNSAVFCSNNVSEGYILDSSDISDDVYCISNAIDCTKECFDGASDVSNIYSDGYQNVDGECVFTVFPGDVDMDGKVGDADLDVIVNYWDQTVYRRNIYYDLEGEELESEYDWRPQYIPFYYVEEGDSCLVRADTNGDGKININDVLAVFINIDQSHNYGNSSAQCNLEVNPRENVDIYYNIYKSLPPSELRSSLARRFDFEIIPESFVFHGNYPNPFNTIASIDFEIPSKGIIGLYIYNLNGQLIFSDTYDVDIGYHSYRWDASNYSSGIYFYELYFNNKMEISSKMILLK